MILRLKDRVLELGTEPSIMGIVNIGEDSVADRLHLTTLAEQLAHAHRQIDEGAQILDIGVQSGRTDTAAITEEQERARLIPLVSALAEQGIPISVETWRSGVARAALETGASIINDVSGLADITLADVAAQTGAALVIMHTRARPKEERFPSYADPVADVLQFLAERIDAAGARGVDPSQLIVDPGLDFAKTPTQSVEVLRRLDELHTLGRPLLLAVSRKYFLGMLTAKEPADRLAGTLAAVEHGVSHGAQIVRVHDVGAVSEFLHVRATLRATGEPELRGDPRAPELKWLEPKGA
jgi:dihydropteroate synthase